MDSHRSHQVALAAIFALLGALLGAACDDGAKSSANDAVAGEVSRDTVPDDGGLEPELASLDEQETDADELLDASEELDIDSLQWRSQLYPSDWTPKRSDGAARFLHDFSYAGYGNGERTPAEDQLQRRLQ